MSNDWKGPYITSDPKSEPLILGDVTGLSKRELFAAFAMQALLDKCRPHGECDWKETVAEDAVDMADALLAALAEEKK